MRGWCPSGGLRPAALEGSGRLRAGLAASGSSLGVAPVQIGGRLGTSRGAELSSLGVRTLAGANGAHSCGWTTDNRTRRRIARGDAARFRAHDERGAVSTIRSGSGALAESGSARQGTAKGRVTIATPSSPGRDARPGAWARLLCRLDAGADAGARSAMGVLCGGAAAVKRKRPAQDGLRMERSANEGRFPRELTWRRLPQVLRCPMVRQRRPSRGSGVVGRATNTRS
jgi:hypothetical protein